MCLAACILGRDEWRHGRSRDETKHRWIFPGSELIYGWKQRKSDEYIMFRLTHKVDLPDLVLSLWKETHLSLAYCSLSGHLDHNLWKRKLILHIINKICDDQGKWVTCRKIQFPFSYTTVSQLWNTSFWCKLHYNWISGYRVMKNLTMLKTI